ncbi:apolipoprotein N-acyltransferase [Orbaceae bacterium ac157xtp]
MFKTLKARALFSFILGAIAVFSYSPFDIWLLAFISFAGLIALIANQTPKRAIILSFCWGIGYFLAGVHWVFISIRQYGELPIPISLLILWLFVCYLALYPLLFGYLLTKLKKFAPQYSLTQLIILSPLLWQFTEYLRANILGGFAWLQFGYTQLNSPLKALFPIIGINGVNLVFCIIVGLTVYIGKVYIAKNAYSQIKQQSTIANKHLYSAICALILLFFAPLLFSNAQWTTTNSKKPIDITLVQANIPQSLRWNSNQLQNTLSTYHQLTEKALKPNSIIIWSEAAIPDIEINQQHYLKQLDHLAKQNQASIAVGIIDLQPTSQDYAIYNSLIVLGDDKPYTYPTSNRYEKHHLVPFGEYVPLDSVLRPIADLLNIPMSSMSAGNKKQKPLTIQGYKFLTVICYEAILSDLVLTNITPDTDFLLTVSNDAWFGNSIGPWQHLQMARTRALEFGRTLLRATNNGITVIVDEKGDITKQMPQFTQGTLKATLTAKNGLTPYATWGNIPYFIICSLMLLFVLFRSKIKQ